MTFNRFTFKIGVLPVLSTLQISHNKLITIEDIANLARCNELKVVDLSYNYLSDPKIVEVSIVYGLCDDSVDCRINNMFLYVSCSDFWNDEGIARVNTRWKSCYS